MLMTCKPKPPQKGSVWTVHTDGATLGDNPSSVGGLGFTVWNNGLLYYAQHSSVVGDVQGNLAEYAALNQALLWIHRHFIGGTISVYTDSKRLVEWFGQKRSVKNPQTKLQVACIMHTLQFVSVDLRWVEREDERQSLTDFISKLGCGGEGVYKTVESHKALLSAFYGEHV